MISEYGPKFKSKAEYEAWLTREIEGATLRNPEMAKGVTDGRLTATQAQDKEAQARINSNADALIRSLAKMTKGEVYEAIGSALLAASGLAHAIDMDFREWEHVSEIAYRTVKRGGNKS